MPKRVPRLSAALEKRHFLNPRLYLSAMPIMLVASVAVSIRDVNISSLLLYTAANIASLAISALVFLAARRALLRGHKQRSSIWQLMTLGLGLGLTKFFSTAWLVVLLGLEADLRSSLESRIGTPFLGIWVVVVVGYITASREQFSSLRERLVNERVAKSLQERAPEGNNGVAELERFLEQSRKLISVQSSTQLSGAQLALLIRQIVDRGLRPLSQKLWEQENQAVPTFQSGALIERALSSGPYPIFSILGILLISNLGGNFREATFAQGVIHLLIQLSFVGLLLVVANHLKKLLPKNGLVRSAQLLAISLIAGFGSAVLPELLVPTQNTSNLWLVGLVSAWWIGTLLVTVGAVAVAVRDNRQQQQMLEELLKADIENQVERSQTLLANRELANHLHSNIQNQLLAQALRLESSNESELEVELANLERILTEAKTLNPSSDQTLEESIDELKTRWQGLLTIDHGALPELNPHASKIAGAVISEAIGNAFRHGFANQVKISFQREKNLLIIGIKDNGLGPRGSGPGLGSMLYDSAGRWKLEPGSNGGTHLTLELFVQNT